MAFTVTSDGSTRKPVLEPAWISGDFNVPEPVVIANGVVFALSNGEDVRQTKEGGIINFSNLTLLTDTQRSSNINRAILHALDAKTGKILFQSGDAMDSWVHFSGLAVADGRVYAVDHNSQVYCFGLKVK
jgi:outer membrane protein assembly factor BamB